MLGVAWFCLLIAPGELDLFLLGSVLAIAAAVPVCGRAELAMGEHDPGSVVLDEIVAVPLCFVGLLMMQTFGGGGFPNLSAFLSRWSWWVLPAGFLAFRVFDIWKPWPVRQIQRLSGGWGVVADDLLAAIWVAVLGVGLAALR